MMISIEEATEYDVVVKSYTYYPMSADLVTK